MRKEMAVFDVFSCFEGARLQARRKQEDLPGFSRRGNSPFHVGKSTYPQGLKPGFYKARDGTAEAAPFQTAIFETRRKGLVSAKARTVRTSQQRVNYASQRGIDELPRCGIVIPQCGIHARILLV